MRKRLKFILLVLLALFIIIQFFPANRPTNELTTGYNFFTSNEVPVEVESIIRNSCFDCHSQESRYPWYSYIAPTSWLVAGDVREGRQHLDFSNWGNLSKKKKLNVLDDIANEVKEGDMPLPVYLIMHRSAKLSISERELIVKWADDMAVKVFGE